MHISSNWILEAAAAKAVTNQADMMKHEANQRRIRVILYNHKRKDREMEAFCEEVIQEHKQLTLAHKTSERCALEPGWDVV